MKAAKILHIRSTYFYGGPERQITYLSEYLSRFGVDSAVATFAPRTDPERNKYYLKLRELGIPSHRIGINGSFDRSPVEEIKKMTLGGKYNLLVGHDYRADFFVLKTAKALHIPAISFSRGWTKKTWKVKLYEWLDLRFLKSMNGVVAVSKDKFSELARRGVDPGRMVYIPNSIPIDNVAARDNTIRDRFNIPHDAFLIGTAGRLSPEKNQEIFIRAAVGVMEQRSGISPKPYFIIAGEGTRKEQLEAMIPERYRNRIIMAGWIDNNDAFYADLDLFVLTSLIEGFPNVLLEAGKYSLPAISTPAGGAIDIIVDGKTGLLFPFGDTEALVGKILSLLDDSDFRNMLRDGLGRITRDKYDARANAARFLDFANSIREQHDKA